MLRLVFTSLLYRTEITERNYVRYKLFHTFKFVYSFSPRNMSSTSSVKPPNVVVFTGKNEENLFRNISINLLRCLHPDKYVVYELKEKQVLESPWKENVALLVMCCNQIEDNVSETFTDYVERGGNMLIFCSKFNMPKKGFICNESKDGLVEIKYKGADDAVVVYHGKYSYNSRNTTILASDNDHKSVIMKVTTSQGTLIASEIHLALSSILLPADVCSSSVDEVKCRAILKNILEEEFGMEVYSLTIPQPTSGYLLVEDEAAFAGLTDILTIKEIPVVKKDQSITASDKPLEISEQSVPLLLESEAAGSILFDKQAYYSKLKTKLFGRIVVFFPVVTSTMIPAEHLSEYKGIVIAARRQTSGRGRGDNVWLSPEGCAMFTLNLTLTLSSFLGQRISILQHMATLAVVNGINKIPGYDKLNLRLKWPNDLYFGNTQKVGGVLVNTTIQGNIVHAYVGIGVNVANDRPTVCINSLIEAHNKAEGDSLHALKVEEVIAYTLSELECLVDAFMESGADSFLASYYNYWIHKDQHVTLSSLKEATVQGIDDYGYLIVKTDDGKTLTLQPDGNRFDIMKNLIVAKE